VAAFVRFCRRALDTSLPTRWVVISSLAVGVAVTLLTLDLGYILGTNEFWRWPVDDSASHVIGFLAFMHEPWRFPLLAVSSFGYPEGGNAAYSCVVPLVAIPAKLIYRTTGWLFFYPGWWVATCRILQAVCAALVLKDTGERRVVPILAVSLLAAGLPCLLDGSRHMSRTQFLILLGLLAYRWCVRAPSLRRTALAATALLLAAALVQPYLLAMVLVLWTAALAERWRRKLIGPGHAIALLGGQVAGLLLVAWACGHLGSVLPRHVSFGMHGMNLLAPFIARESTFIPAERILASSTRLSPVDGNYLGLGLLLLLLVALVSVRRALVKAVKRHPVLCAAMVALVVFSLSNRVYVGDKLAFSYGLPDPVARLANIFRHSIRFFWPVTVTLIVWLVAVIARRFSAPVGAAVLVALCTVQWLDLKAVRAHALEDSARSGAPDALGDGRAAWTALIARERLVATFPSYDCAQRDDDDEFDLQLQLVAVRAQVLINSAYLAHPYKDCRREAEWEQRALRAPPPPGVLHVFYRRAGQPPPVPEAGGDPTICREFSDVDGPRGVACTRQWAGHVGTPWSPTFRVKAPRSAPR
jgi:hypothetical protein